MPSYAIMNFAMGKVEVHKFEGCTAMETGAFEARLREIASHREREKEARDASQMLGELFSLGFASAELEALKQRKAEREKQERMEKEQQARLEQEKMAREIEERQEKEKEERVRLKEIEKEQERRRQEEDRLKKRPMHVQELLAMDLDKAPIREIKSLMERMCISHVGCTSRQDLATQLVQQVPELRLKCEQEAAQSEAAQVQREQEKPLRMSPNKLSAGDLKSSSVSQLKAVLEEMGIPSQGYTSKEDMIQAIQDARAPRCSSDEVSKLRAQHAEEKLRSERERLELQLRQLEKKLIRSEESERSLNRDLSEAKKQAKIMAERAAAAERRANETAGEAVTLKRRNTELESLVKFGAASSGAARSRTPVSQE